MKRMFGGVGADSGVNVRVTSGVTVSRVKVAEVVGSGSGPAQATPTMATRTSRPRIKHALFFDRFTAVHSIIYRNIDR
jgi:hypothetical protein